ncbi:hypothetical protein, partial [Escherichia coli]
MGNVERAKLTGPVFKLFSESAFPSDCIDLPIDKVVNLTAGTVAKLAMRQPFVLFKGLTFQKLCLP